MASKTAFSARRGKAVIGFTVPIVVTALLILISIVLLMQWSGREVDRLSVRRDHSIVNLVMSKGLYRIAHLQEAATIWDEAVEEVQQVPLDMAWVDTNLGTWFYQYAHIDEVYLLNAQNVPIYAMQGGQRALPQTYVAIEDSVTPLLSLLRKTHSVQSITNIHSTLSSAGQGDVAIVRGRPAFVSLKPIVSDTGRLKQVPGTEPVHVAIVYLDATSFAQIGTQYGLSNAQFSATPLAKEAYQSKALQDRHGKIIAYANWRPFAPGTQVIGALAPVLVIVMLLSICVISILSIRLARRTRDLELSRQEAQHRATHDDLTGLGNRTMFETRLNEAIARAEKYKSLQALLYIDLDRFKQVNDTLGHPSGDDLIRQVAERLSAEVRCYDLVSRLGGDEFAVLISDPGDKEAVEAICSRIVCQLEQPFDINGSQAYIGASIGVAMAPSDGVDATELTRKADIALYKAKNEGRSRYVFFTPDLDRDVQLREESYRDLRVALEDCENRLQLHYQPIYSIDDGRMLGVEALLRWHHPEQGLIGPADFIRSAEESGLIEVIGEWVLRRAVRDAQAWPHLRIAVNVSPIQLRSRKFVETVREILEAGSIKPARLELELTETALMGASTDVARALSELRWLGVGCALDDFGTGYSSLSHIRDLAVDRIKIDRSFVNAVESVSGAALVEAIVSLARANGLRLTAEGVETKEQYAFLRRVGCHEVQGYLLSRPVPADQIERLLQIPRPSIEDRPQMLI